MTKITDAKGVEITVGARIKVKGSSVERVVESGVWGSSDELHANEQGFVLAQRVDGGNVSFCAWIDPKKAEVIV